MRLEDFIERQRDVLESLDPNQSWDEKNWDTKNWLKTRGSRSLYLPFTILGTKDPLPKDFSDFSKSMIVAIYQAKRPSYAALYAYLNEIRRLFNILSSQGKFHPSELRNGHFFDSIKILKESKYKNIYDAANNMGVIAIFIDKYELSEIPIDFVNPISAPPPRLRHDPKIEQSTLPSKLPSKEALEAFAACTNNPISESEEIILRVIDLHIAMGTRVNETLVIPLDCWIEHDLIGADGEYVIDPMTGTRHKEFGIRYFPEKKFAHNVHWLADSDVPLAKRAINRLQTLTSDARKVAQWQDDNPERLWDVNPDEIVSRSFINRFVETAAPYDVDRIMKRLNVNIIHKNFGNNSYRAGDIENAFLAERDEQVVLRSSNKNLLKVHECLCIGFRGAFRFKERTNSTNRLLVNLIKYQDLTAALGNTSVESIFDRRNLTEADGARISLRTHQSRHWRNTLYKLGGMTEIQQALAMGRKDISQNVHYQHVALNTELSAHSAFVEFSSYQEKILYLRKGIESGRIQGALADTFHSIKINDPVKGQEFLETHAGGVHVTLWGICTNDFSREPCTKHLQCFDDCGHLHRTDNQHEKANLQNLLDLNLRVLEKMISDCEDDAGSDKWISEQRRKVEGIRKAISLGDRVGQIPIKVFPNSPTKMIANRFKRGSSV